VAAGWTHEGELERFMVSREGLCDLSRPFVHVQHPYSSGAFSGFSLPDASRPPALRRQMAALDADIIGLAEFNPTFS